ncbi:MAG: helix-turn-helix transcriptional regulator [Clostridia bacterium]|nr:helix-turn-helix transcriptional regulator [Clostridia bacterium]
MLEVVKGIAPNIFIITFTSRSPAMRYFEGRRLTASMAVKQHVSAILHEATETFELTFNNPRMQPLRLREAPLFGGEQTVRLRLELMLIDIIRSDDRYAPQEPQRMYFTKDVVTDPLALRMIAYMEDHLHSRFTMEEMARALSFGKAYLSRYFSRVCGYSVIDYFAMMKIGEAKRLIRETDKNFGEISELLAFSNPHYFSATFKKHTGMTPTQYKRSSWIV